MRTGTIATQNTVLTYTIGESNTMTRTVTITAQDIVITYAAACAYLELAPKHDFGFCSWAQHDFASGVFSGHAALGTRSEHHAKVYDTVMWAARTSPNVGWHFKVDDMTTAYVTSLPGYNQTRARFVANLRDFLLESLGKVHDLDLTFSE